MEQLQCCNNEELLLLGADWSITMPEQGNQLTISGLAFSASGSIVMVGNMGDTVSASSTSVATQSLKAEFNLGEDSILTRFHTLMVAVKN